MRAAGVDSAAADRVRDRVAIIGFIGAGRAVIGMSGRSGRGRSARSRTRWDDAVVPCLVQWADSFRYSCSAVLLLFDSASRLRFRSWRRAMRRSPSDMMVLTPRANLPVAFMVSRVVVVPTGCRQ